MAMWLDLRMWHQLVSLPIVKCFYMRLKQLLAKVLPGQVNEILEA